MPSIARSNYRSMYRSVWHSCQDCQLVEEDANTDTLPIMTQLLKLVRTREAEALVSMLKTTNSSVPPGGFKDTKRLARVQEALAQSELRVGFKVSTPDSGLAAAQLGCCYRSDPSPAMLQVAVITCFGSCGRRFLAIILQPVRVQIYKAVKTVPPASGSERRTRHFLISFHLYKASDPATCYHQGFCILPCDKHARDPAGVGELNDLLHTLEAALQAQACSGESFEPNNSTSGTGIICSTGNFVAHE
jgi:hypothetical protein